MKIIYQTWTTIENVHLLSYYDNVIDCNFESSLSIPVYIRVLVQSNTMIQISILSVDTTEHCVSVAGGCIQFISIVGIRHISRYLDTRHDAVPGWDQGKISQKKSSMAIFPRDTDGVLQSGLCGPGPGERGPTSLQIQLSSG